MGGDETSKDGPPKLISADNAEAKAAHVAKSDIEQTRDAVFGRRSSRVKNSGKSSTGKSLKSAAEVINAPPMSAPPKHSSSICNKCGDPDGIMERELALKEKSNETKVEVELPNLRSSFIESVFFGSSVKESRPPVTRFFKGTSMLDHQKRRPFRTGVARQELLRSADPYHSEVVSILNEIPPPLSFFDKKPPESKQSNVSSTSIDNSDTLLNKAAKIPIMWKGKPSTVKDYLLEKSYIC